MKKILVFFSFVLLFCLSVSGMAMAQGYALQWDNGDPGNVTGYVVYYSDDPADPDKYHKTLVGENNTLVTFVEMQLIPGVQYECYVTAYNVNGESGSSNHVVAVREPFVPPTDSLPPVSSEPSGPNNLVQQ